MGHLIEAEGVCDFAYVPATVPEQDFGFLQEPVGNEL